MEKLKAKEKPHYVDNKKFLLAMSDWRLKCQKAEEKNRSLDQNALLHSVINKMARSQGWEAERMKQHLKNNYGLKDSNGELISTTKYSTQEMADFITELLAVCAEFDVDVRKERTEWTQKTSEQ